MASDFPIPFTGRPSAVLAGLTPNDLFSGKTGIRGGKPQVRAGLSQLARGGDAFAFLDLPPGAHVGCDTLVGTTNQDAAESADVSETSDSNAPDVTGVCGFRDIPPGAHFAWVSAPGAMSRQGCWFIAQRPSTAAGSEPSPGVVRTKKWDRFHEVLTDFDYSSHNQATATGDLASAFSQLIPYTTGSDQKDKKAPVIPLPGRSRHEFSNDIELWRQVTSCITVPVLGRIAGSSGTTTAMPNEWLFSTTDTSKDEVAVMGGMAHSNAGAGIGSNSESSEFHFLFAKDDLDAYRLMAQERKKDGNDAENSNVDSSDTTERILALLEHSQSKLSEADLIGELQFAFLTGIVLSNLSCLEQWWHFVLRVFLRARHLVARRPSLCRAFLETLLAQLTYLERFTVGKITRLSPRTGLVAEANDDTDADGNDRGTSIFDAKPQGAVRLRAALAVFRRQFKFSSNDDDAQVDEKSILSTSLAEASASEAFMDLEALLWKYGWDLSGSGDRQDRSEAEAAAKGKRTDYNEDNDDDELEIYDTPLKEGAQEGTRRVNTHSALSDSEDEDDDYQPVVVEMDENGNEVGLVSWN